MAIQALSSNTVRALGANQAVQDSVAVVKELIDNALDAGAKLVVVEVSANLLDVIQIRDDGTGIPPEDRALLGQPHCTSKIRNEGDLQQIGGSSLGFRGEAIASIAELSGGLSIATRVQSEQVASVMTFNRAGGITGTTRASLPVGTLVKVTDFLHTNSVRRRLALKSSQTDLLKVKRIMQAYAFARPWVRLTLKVLNKNGKGDFLYPPSGEPTVEHVTTKIFGVRCSSQCTIAEVEHNGYVMRAYLPRSDAEIDCVSGLGCFISCDQRPMSNSKGIFKQIYRMFRTSLQTVTNNCTNAVEPFLALEISCEASSYDANIEPVKDDVIFQDPETVLHAARKLFNSVYHYSSQATEIHLMAVGADFNNQLPTPFPSSVTAPDTVITSNDDRHAPTADAQPVLAEHCSIMSFLATPENSGTGSRSAQHEELFHPPLSQQRDRQPASTGDTCHQRTQYGTQRERAPHTSKAPQRSLNRSYSPTQRQGRERVWFDHLEPLERRERFSRPSRQHGNFVNQVRRELGDLVNDPRPLSPPHRNRDIRSFCEPQSQNTLLVSVPDLSQTDLPPAAKLGGSSRSEKYQGGSINLSPCLPLNQEKSPLNLSSHIQAANSMAGGSGQKREPLRHISLNSTGQSRSAQKKQSSKHYRDASAQLLAFSLLSPATRSKLIMSACMEDMNKDARLMQTPLSVPGWNASCLVKALPLAQTFDAAEIAQVSRQLERMLVPVDPRRSIIPRLCEAIAAAVKSQCSAYADMVSDTELLI